MKKSLLSLVLLCSTACRTSEASSTANQPVAAVPASSVVGAATPQAAESPKVKTEDKSLLKWRIGRWTIVKDGNEKMDKPGSVACDVTSALVIKHLGNDKLNLLEAAIAEVYKIKDQRQSSPIFRGLDKSRELVAIHNGQEFMIEKMFQSRDSINAAPASVVSRDIAKAGDAEAALETIMEIAINPLICPKVPS
jgi:hypothetical protein